MTNLARGTHQGTSAGHAVHHSARRRLCSSICRTHQSVSPVESLQQISQRMQSLATMLQVSVYPMTNLARGTHQGTSAGHAVHHSARRRLCSSICRTHQSVSPVESLQQISQRMQSLATMLQMSVYPTTNLVRETHQCTISARHAAVGFIQEVCWANTLQPHQTVQMNSRHIVGKS